MLSNLFHSSVTKTRIKYWYFNIRNDILVEAVVVQRHSISLRDDAMHVGSFVPLGYFYFFALVIKDSTALSSATQCLENRERGGWTLNLRLIKNVLITGGHRCVVTYCLGNGNRCGLIKVVLILFKAKCGVECCHFAKCLDSNGKRKKECVDTWFSLLTLIYWSHLK